MNYCAKRSMQDWGFPIYTAAGPRILPTSAACPPATDFHVNLGAGEDANAQPKMSPWVFMAGLLVFGALGVGYGVLVGGR